MSTAKITTPSTEPRIAPAPDIALWFEVQSFLVREARLMDDGALREWVELFTDDVRYWMPIITNRTGRDVGREWTKPGELAHFEEDKTSLRNRVKRLSTGMAWAETPRSRTRHLVSNVELMGRSDEGELHVRSNFLVYRSHLEYDSEVFAGRRDDLLRRVGDAWRIARRTIILDQSVVTQKNLGIFF